MTDTKLCFSHLVGARDLGWAKEFIRDCASRIRNRVQITTDGHKAYLDAVEEAFGADIDAQLQKIYGAPTDAGMRKIDKDLILKALGEDRLTIRVAAVVGASLGLIVCCLILALLWFGVFGVLVIDGTNLGHVFWPASLVLTLGWKSTIPGVTTTIYAVISNCGIYVLLAIAIRTAVVRSAHLWKS